MASRPGPSRGRSAARSSTRSGSGGGSQQGMIIGGIAVVVVIVLVLVMRSGGGGAAAATNGDKAAAKESPKAETPAPPSGAPVELAGAKAGKPAGRPAPPLPAETLQQLNDLFAKAKALYAEGVKARTAGDNTGARQKQSEATKLLEQWRALIEKQLNWQEEAQMGDWAMPAEYMTLEKLYLPYQDLLKRVRMGGG